MVTHTANSCDIINNRNFDDKGMVIFEKFSLMRNLKKKIKLAT